MNVPSEFCNGRNILELSDGFTNVSNPIIVLTNDKLAFVPNKVSVSVLVYVVV